MGNTVAPTDKKLGRNARHQYTLDTRPPLKLKPDGTPYANQPKPRHHLPSVTTISGQIDKSGLAWAAAKEAATMAVNAQHRWAHLPTDQAIELIRKEHDRIWKIKAGIGTIVHDVALDWATGREADVDAHIEAANLPIIDGELDAAMAKIHGHIDALERFYSEQSPVFSLAEATVAHDVENEEFAGCFDGLGTLAEFGDSPVMIDFKTGSIYPPETTLQLAGYSLANIHVLYGDDGFAEEIKPFDAPEIYAGVWLHEDGNCTVKQLPVDSSARQEFLHLRGQRQWRRGMDAWTKANITSK